MTDGRGSGSARGRGFDAGLAAGEGPITQHRAETSDGALVAEQCDRVIDPLLNRRGNLQVLLVEMSDNADPHALQHHSAGTDPDVLLDHHRRGRFRRDALPRAPRRGIERMPVVVVDPYPG